MKKIIFTLASLSLVACKSPIEESYEEHRADYCEGDSVKCVELANSNQGLSSVTMGDLSSTNILSSADVASSSSGVFVETKTMTDDRDSQIYNTVVIGEAEWFAQNLNYGTILEVPTGPGAPVLEPGQKFCYDNDEKICESDGAHYSWNAAMDLATECGDGSKNCEDQINTPYHKGACPTGWHIPTDGDWQALIDLAGGANELGKYLKVSEFYGEDTWGFKMIASGFLSPGNSLWDNGRVEVPEEGKTLIRNAAFWKTKENQEANAYYFYFLEDNNQIKEYDQRKDHGYSVRCVKD
ncbi:hypothetical protein OAU52_00410 [bacterium]|nr:hypothetical protein [bacterium]